MDDLLRQMVTSEKPRDVSGVELLMNNHQGHKAEIDARDDNFGECISLGKELLTRSHYASNEIKEKLKELTGLRNTMLHRWEERWEHLQLILEVYQFARDAAVAEAWLIAQDPYLKSEELGESIDEVENLIKKHEAFEKAAATQEERFAALERLTTFELKELNRRQEEEAEKRRQESIQAAQVAAAQSSPATGHGTGERGETASIKSGISGRRGSTSSSTKGAAGGGSKGASLKSRGRSKSPFRSFRWPKKSPTKSEAAASSRDAYSDDEDNAPRHFERVDGEEMEGMLIRKHQWESTTKKASNRSWDKVCVVLRGNQIGFYKDQKSWRTSPEATYRGEPPIDIAGGQAEVATDYTKKRNVFRLRLSNGGDYLFQANDNDEMVEWVNSINRNVQQDQAGHESSGAKSQTLPAGIQGKDEPKKRSFFTLKKK